MSIVHTISWIDIQALIATAVALCDAYRLAMAVMTARFVFVEMTSCSERISWLRALKNVLYLGVNLLCG
jgi:hypothetical protein